MRKTARWVILALVIALLAWKLHGSHFDWMDFWRTCRSVDWRLLLLAVCITWTNAMLRALRWSIFLKPSLRKEDRVAWWQLIGSQYIGFAGLAAFGRIGELIRPYLVSKRTGLSFSSQIAVVAVERIFDLGAFALIFSTNLALAPQLNTLPYHERFHTMGFAVAGIVAVLFVFVIAIRIAGETMARICGRAAGTISRRAGSLVAAKILEFRSGLNTIESAGDFAMITLISLVMWFMIALVYVVVMRAFPAPVHDLTMAHCFLLMGFSIIGSVVQLPGIGGGAQVMVITALTILFGIPKEMATSAGMILWFANTMCLLIPGLIFARLEHVSLRSIARSSAAAESVQPAR